MDVKFVSLLGIESKSLKSLEEKARHTRDVRNWKAANPERWSEIHKRAQKKYYASHKKQHIAGVERWRKTTAKGMAYSVRKSRKMCLAQYGLTEAAYDVMLASQNGVCAICGGLELHKRGHLHVDHDHVSGRVRALLCSLCNAMLGYARDNPSLLSKGAAYLLQHQD